MSQTVLKHKAVKEYIYQYISEKGLENGDKLPTEKEICEMLDVSRITAQRAIQDMLAEKAVYRIQGSGTFVGAAAVENKTTDIGYIPLIMSNTDETFRFREVIQGVEGYLSGRGCHVTLHTMTYGDSEKMLRAVTQNHKCAMIMPGASHVDNKLYFDLQNNGVKLVFIDILPANISTNYVSSDNISGGYIATKHLIDRGYKKIFTTSTPPITANSIADRLTGYRLAHEEAGLDYRPDYNLLFQEYRPLEAYLDDILKHPDKADAIFAINDTTAVLLSNLCIRKGVRVPEDIAIIGYDNSSAGANLPIPISTIDQKFYEFGYEAAKLAYKCCYEDSNVTSHTILPVKLIERASTAPKK